MVNSNARGKKHALGFQAHIGMTPANVVLHADYKWSLRGLSGPELEAAQRAVHQRSADRLQRLAFANGGIYIKIGQHIAQLVRGPRQAPSPLPHQAPAMRSAPMHTSCAPFIGPSSPNDALPTHGARGWRSGTISVC